MPTLKQRDRSIQRQLERIDYWLLEAARRKLDPVELIQRGIANHDKRNKAWNQTLHDMPGTAADRSRA